MICPDCGYVMGPLDKNCPRCRNVGKPVSAPPQPDATIVAPVSSPLPPSPAQPQLPANMMPCRVCGNPVSCAAQSCPRCGEIFEPPTEWNLVHICLVVWALLNTIGVGIGTANAALIMAGASPSAPGADVNFAMIGAALLLAWLWVLAWWAFAISYGKQRRRDR